MPLITVVRDRCLICRSVKLEEALSGPFMVCTECRQMQSRYEQRAPRPEEVCKGHGAGARR
jgi:hypothetical protein